MRVARRSIGLLAVAVAGLTACERASVTEPGSLVSSSFVPLDAGVLPAVPASTPYPATQQAGRAIVCKNSSSPAGNYTFSVSAAPIHPGDQVAATVILAPGQCAIVFNRPVESSLVTNVTVTEQIPQGATYRLNHIAKSDGDGSSNVAGPGVTLKINLYHGGTAEYFNEPVPAAGLPTPTPYPGAPTQGSATVCKDASSPAGSYNFTFSATGLLPGDQVASAATLQPGQCALIYLRATSSLSNTNITFTETIPQGASFTLNHVAVNDQDGPRSVAGPGVTLKVNSGHGAIATYFNEAAVVVGPRQVTVCKAGQVHGSFNFTAVATGTIGTDALTSTFSLFSGGCQVIFLRPIPGLASASITIAEVANVGTTLNGVTVNGSAATVVGAAVVVSQGTDANKIVIFTNINAAVTPPTINLGTASNFGILAASTVTCVTGSSVGGDIGNSPGTALTGFGPCTLSGSKQLATPISAQAQLDLTVAFNALTALPCPPANVLTADLGGTTKAAGVYCSATGIGLTGTVTLDGGGDPNATFVFQSASTIITAGNVVLINGAQAKNVFFVAGSSATLGTNSQIKGNILAQASITINDNVTLIGRALARTAAVTLGTGVNITLP